MDERATGLASLIGGRVRHERQQRGWTLEQLATAASVSRRMVINVEHGSVNPSVGTLLRLAEALGVGLPTLVEPPERSEVSVTRSGDGAVLWVGPAGGRGVLVAGREAPDVFELWDWTLAPGDGRTSELHTTGARELIHVLEGEVSLEAAGRSVLLGTGDAASFPGDAPHGYRNAGEHPARFTLAVLEPDVRGAGGRGGGR
jgi:transcriptional regulator with XRE-family HTH domain